MIRKAHIFYALMLVVPVFVLELFCQGLFYWKYGTPPWRAEPQEVFNFRPFSQRVADDRYVTMRPGASVSLGDWSVHTDGAGFRAGSPSTSFARTDASILFLGDSVPFGWGVEAAHSLPAQLEQRLREKGDTRPVINAAIPSYSLDQARARYMAEIHGRLPVDIIVVWSYDPVTQLALLGSAWRPDVNWSTQSPEVAKRNRFRLEPPVYSATLALLEKFAARLIEGTAVIEHLSPDDKTTAIRFQEAVDATLSALREHATKAGTRQIILMPLTAPKSSQDSFSPARKSAVQLYNTAIKTFAAQHENTRFLDAQALLDKYPEQEIFLDRCCHLTQKGNALVAAELSKLMLLAP